MVATVYQILCMLQLAVQRLIPLVLRDTIGISLEVRAIQTTPMAQVLAQQRLQASQRWELVNQAITGCHFLKLAATVDLIIQQVVVDHIPDQLQLLPTVPVGKCSETGNAKRIILHLPKVVRKDNIGVEQNVSRSKTVQPVNTRVPMVNVKQVTTQVVVAPVHRLQLAADPVRIGIVTSVPVNQILSP